ncbi:Hypothetical protein A7982_09344 [Minicystis rosea]|nr:Hypothetical protein A7982_09344 [Minicystis rosea]
MLLLSAMAVAIASSPRTASAQSAGDTARARVHFETEAPDITLFEYGGRAGGADRPICRAPCDRILESGPERQYYFGSEELRRSKRFSLGGRTDDVSIKVFPGSKDGIGTGVVSVAVGGGLILGGAMMGFFFSRVGSQGGPNGAVLITGTAMAGTGLAAIVIGVVLVATTRPTKYLISRVAPAPGGFAIRF